MDDEALQASMQSMIENAAPERTAELSELWKRYQPSFRVADDRGDFQLEAGSFGLVLFTPKTILMIWLLAQEAFEAVDAYGTQVRLFDRFGLLRVGAVRRRFRELLLFAPDQRRAESRIERVALERKRLRDSVSLTEYRLPRFVTLPTASRPQETRSAAIYDVACIATAALFLHEVQHVRDTKDGDANSDAHEAELRCDAFAVETLLKSADVYARRHRVAERKVRSKRAAGLAVAMYVVCRLTEHSGGTTSHPPLRERTAKLGAALDLPSSDWFWAFFASTLLAELRVRDCIPHAVAATNARTLCMELAAAFP